MFGDVFYLLVRWRDVNDVIEPAGSEEGAIQAVRSVCGGYNHHIFVAHFLAVQLSKGKKQNTKCSLNQLTLITALSHYGPITQTKHPKKENVEIKDTNI